MNRKEAIRQTEQIRRLETLGGETMTTRDRIILYPALAILLWLTFFMCCQAAQTIGEFLGVL